MKKHLTKRILALWLSVCMALTMMPTMAFAAEINTTGITSLTVCNQSVTDVNGEGTKIAPYTATVYVENYDTLKVSLTSSNESATLKYAVNNDPATAPEISQSVEGMSSGNVTDATIEGLNESTQVLWLEYDEDGSAGGEKYFAITVKAYASGSVTATLEGTLTQEAAVSEAKIKLTATTLKFKESGLTASDFELSGDGATGLSISSVENGGSTDEGVTVTLVLSGTPTTVGTVTVKCKPSAFQTPTKADVDASGDVAVTAKPVVVTLTAAPSELTAEDDVTQVTLTASGSNFAASLSSDKFTLSGDAASGVTVTNVNRDSDTQATLTLSAAPTTAGTLTITVDKDQFETQPGENPTVDVTVNAKAVVVTLTAAPSELTAEGDVTQVTLTASGSNFAASLSSDKFTLSGDAASGVTVTNVNRDSDTQATLTLSAAPTTAGTLTITVDKDQFETQPGEAPTVDITVNAKAVDAGQTVKPAIKGAEESATVMCEEGDTKAVLELTNSYTGEVKVTVKDEEGSQVATGVTGEYADGKITLTFDPKLEKETTYQISVQEGEKKESEAVKVTVKLYKATTATPEAEGETFEITAQPGNKSAEIKLSNSNSYSGEVTVNVYKSADGNEKADDVETATYSGGTITLNFKTALSQEVTYKISLTEADKNESATVEVTITPYPTTATPTFESDTVTAEADNKAAVFTVTNASSFSGEVTVKLYQESGEAVSDDSVTGAYAGGKLTLTFKDAISKAQKYTVEFQMANADPSEKSAQITVKPYKQTTATPQVEAEGDVTVNCDSSANNQALIVLVNAMDYTAETVTVKVYNAAGSEAATDVTGTYKDGVITLKATEGTLSGNTYQVALMEDGKEESGKLTVKVEAYKASDDATITNVTGFISGDSKSYTGETPDEVEATGQSIADAIPVDIFVPAGTTITKITFNVANKDVKVTYANTTTLTDDQGFTSADPQSGTNSEGTVTIDSLDFGSNKLLYVNVTAEDNSTKLYYAISVRTVDITAGEAEIVKDIPTDDATALQNLVDAKKTAIAASSATELNSTILDDIAATPGLLDKINEPSDAATATANDGSAWGALKAANANIDTSGDLHFFYVPELEIVVAEGGFDADAKTLTVNITPYYKVIVTTQDDLSSATLTGDPESIDAAVFIDKTELTTLKDVTVTIGVPTDIAAANAKVYVQHENDGWNEYTVTAQNTVDVKVPHFSEFQLRGDVPGQAMIGTKVYATLQEAIDAVSNEGKITLTKEAANHLKDLTPPTTGVKKFTIEAGTSGLDASEVTFKETSKDGYTYTANNASGTVTVSWTKDYKITVNNSGNGTMTADKTTAKVGDTVTLSVTSGTLESVTAKTKGETTVNITEGNGNYTFVMPEDDVIVTAKFESSSSYTGGGGGSGTSSTVNKTNPVNGNFSISNPNAKTGDTVTVTTQADDGYVVDKVTVTDNNNKEIPVTQNADGTYSFVMPEADAQPVKVDVTFKKKDEGGEVTPPTADPLVFSSKAQERDIANRLTTSKDTSLKLKAADEDVKIGSLKDWDVTSDNEAVVKVLKPGNKLRYMDVGTANITVKATGSNDKVYSIVIPIKVKLGTPTFTLSHYSSKKARTFTVTTSTVRGATGFQVKYSLKKSLKSSKTKTYKCGKKLNRKTIKANKSGRTYYVRVRAYKTVDGKRTYGAWSKLTKTIRSR